MAGRPGRPAVLEALDALRELLAEQGTRREGRQPDLVQMALAPLGPGEPENLAGPPAQGNRAAR
ncbi:MAG: hypothetical protein AB1511_11765 [Deinococcota bacterium]